MECNGRISPDVDGPDRFILLVYHHRLVSEYPSIIIRQNAGKKKYNSFFFFSFFLQSLDYAQQSTLVTRSDNGVNS